MPRFQDIVTDNEGNGLPGAIVTVRDYPSGNLSTLTADSGGSLTNPIVADANGAYYFNAANAIYSLEFRLLAYEPAREVHLVNLGNLVDSVTLAATTGAALIGTTHSGSLDVQLDALLGKNFGVLGTGSTNTLDVERQASGAVDGTTQWYGEQKRMYLQGSHSADFARSSYKGTHYQGTAGVLNNLQGTHQYIWHEGLGGSVANAEIVTGHLRVDGGAITNEVDILNAAATTLGVSASVNIIVGVRVGNIGDATKVTTAYGVNVTDFAAVGTVAALRTETTAGTNKYAIFTGGGAQHALGGFVGVNFASAPTYPLDVRAGTTWSNTIADLSNGHASNPFGMRVRYSGSAPNSTTNEFIICADNAATRFAVRSNGSVAINGLQIIGNRRTGWTAPTGTATRTTFDTGTVTLGALAQAVKALIDDLMAHGAIGT